MFKGMNLFNKAEKPSVKDAKLTQYVYSQGGDMRGGFSRETIELRKDGKVRISYEGKEWHNSDTVTWDKTVDAAVLEEIETVFKENGMEKWDNKTLTDMFVCDGANYTYCFKFDNGTSVRFSSQMYPQPYSDILGIIHEIIDKYLN